MAACKAEAPPLQAQVWGVHAGLTQLYQYCVLCRQCRQKTCILCRYCSHYDSNLTPPSLLLLIVAATLVMICDYHHRRAKYNTWKKAELAAVSPCSSPGPGHTAADYRQVADIFTHAHKYFYLATVACSVRQLDGRVAGVRVRRLHAAHRRPGTWHLQVKIVGNTFKNIFIVLRSRTRLCVPGSKSVPVTPVASHAHRRRRLLRRSETVEDYNKVTI